MSVAYNRLNLPQQVSKGSDALAYGYSADGQKREKKFNGIITQQYRSNMVYDGAGNPEYVIIPEGMVRKVGSSWIRQYNLADHLGNTRAVLEPNGSVLQQADYYPFGTAFSVANLNKNKYLYGGKEYQDEVLGGTLIGLADFEARFLDSRISRFTSMDPLAEKFYSVSPYAYCNNSPVLYVDPSGLIHYSVNAQGYIQQMKDEDGNILGAEDKFDMLYVLNADGKKNEDIAGMRVNDQSILSDLSQNRNDYDGKYVNTTSSEVGSVFLFAATHTDVEWGLYSFSDKGYFLSTSHNKESVSNATSVDGFNEENMIFKIHSHPGPNGTPGASGDMRKTGGGYMGDMANITRIYERMQNKKLPLPTHYIYHRESKTLYNYTPWNSSIPIRKIKSYNTGLNFLIPQK